MDGSTDPTLRYLIKSPSSRFNFNFSSLHWIVRRLPLSSHERKHLKFHYRSTPCACHNKHENRFSHAFAFVQLITIVELKWNTQVLLSSRKLICISVLFWYFGYKLLRLARNSFASFNQNRTVGATAVTTQNTMVDFDLNPWNHERKQFGQKSVRRVKNRALTYTTQQSFISFI